MADVDKSIIFPFGLCGHFALGTLSKTHLKDAVNEINVSRKNVAQNDKIQKCQIWHQNQKPYQNYMVFSLN